MINEIDPKIYNFKNLKLEDHLVVASQFKIFLLIRKEKENFNSIFQGKEVMLELLGKLVDRFSYPGYDLFKL